MPAKTRSNSNQQAKTEARKSSVDKKSSRAQSYEVTPALNSPHHSE